MTHIKIPVLIVGGGPAGLTAASLLAQYGIRTLLVSKHKSTAHSPRAHITNQRTVEIFRDMGIQERILKTATAQEQMGNNVWATSFTGPEIGRLQAWGTHLDRKGEYEKHSPVPLCNLPQHLMEPILADFAREQGADLRFYQELLDFEQDADGVTASVLDRATNQTYTVRAEYMIGADGGKSRVAEKLGLEFLGESGLGNSINCWFKADLSKYCAYRPGVLYWIVTPGNDYWVGSGTFICVRPWHEWVMLFMYDPSQGEPDLSETALIERVRRLVGDADLTVDLKGVSKWQINHLVAKNYAKGRVFCVGDAVHRHPPANGLGSNTSVQDAYNLAWKLKLVLERKAAASLLNTYSAERQPVGRQVVDRAMQSVIDMRPISSAIGFKPGQSEAEGWQNLAIVNEASEEGRQRRKQLADAITLQNYQFNAQGVELGQRYRKGAVVADGSVEPPYTRDPELHYHPTTFPGARLPHAWLHHRGQRLSTLDLVGKGRFALLTGSGGNAWSEAARQAGERFSLPIDAYAIDNVSYGDSYGQWAQLRDIDDDGCVLVRPDGYVGWRSSNCPPDATEKLINVVGDLLGIRQLEPNTVLV